MCYRVLLFACLLFLFAGCRLLPVTDAPVATPIIVRITPSTPQPATIEAFEPHTPTAVVLSPTPQATPTPLPSGLVDALPVMSGICFEAANDAAGQLFVIRNAEEHINFYDLADNSQLCSRPVVRHPFDFTQGDILAGLWTQGRGCTAQHEIISVERDDEARTLRIITLFRTEGSCNYELVRPFWVSIPGASDYAITIEVGGV